MSGVDLTAIDALAWSGQRPLERIRAGPAGFRPRTILSPNVRLAPYKRSAGANSRKGKIGRAERARGRRPPHGRAVVAPQSDGAGRLLPPSRPAPRGRCRRVCDRSEARPMHLPPAPLGATCYVDEGAAAYEKRYHQARVNRLAASAKDLGFALVSVEA